MKILYNMHTLSIYCIMLGLISFYSVKCAENNNDALFKTSLTRTITNENFKFVLSEANLGIFVMYTAPWCGHCKRLYPIWNDLANKHNVDKNFIIAKVDCTLDTELCSNEDILGYPTFVFYRANTLSGQRFTDTELSYDNFELFMFDQVYQKKKNNRKPQEKRLLSLTDDNFSEVVTKGFTFVKFFAPWCGHCKAMAKTWADLVGVIDKVEIAEVDCTIEGEICHKYNVRGYPTLLLFYNGAVAKQFKGQRTTDEFITFMNEIITKLDVPKSEPKKIQDDEEKIDPSLDPVLEITNENENAAFQRQGLLFVKFFAPWCAHCKKMAQTWRDLAYKYVNDNNVLITQIDCIKSSELCQKHAVNKYPTLILFKDGKLLENYSGERDLNSFSQFLNPYLVTYHEDL